MRKSTLAAVLLLAALLSVFLWFGITSVREHEPEIALATDMTREFAEDLDPHPDRKRVRARRERGNDRAIVSDPALWGLLLNAHPSEDAWRSDPAGKALGRRLADFAYPRYGPERPVRYVEVVLIKASGEKVRLGYREDRDGNLEGFAVPPLPAGGS